MKKKFSFSIKSLVYNTDDCKAPIEQSMFANQMAQKNDDRFYNTICRLTFSDKKLNKPFPGGVPLMETLLIGRNLYSESTLHIYARGKGTFLSIATGYFPSRKIVIHNEYRNTILLGKLTDEQITTIYNKVWDSPELIAPLPARLLWE